MLHSIKTEEIVEIKKESEELYLQVDGGHIRDKGKDKQSFEAIISRVYSIPTTRFSNFGSQNLAFLIKHW